MDAAGAQRPILFRGLCDCAGVTADRLRGVLNPDGLVETYNSKEGKKNKGLMSLRTFFAASAAGEGLTIEDIGAPYVMDGNKRVWLDKGHSDPPRLLSQDGPDALDPLSQLTDHMPLQLMPRRPLNDFITSRLLNYPQEAFGEDTVWKFRKTRLFYKDDASTATHTPLHWDSFDQLVLHCFGEKRWTISPPCAQTLETDVQFCSEGFVPAVQKSVVVGAGDVLWLPAGWCHCVDTLEAAAFTINWGLPPRR
jgi:hypothetical protein